MYMQGKIQDFIIDTSSVFTRKISQERKQTYGDSEWDFFSIWKFSEHLA